MRDQKDFQWQTFCIRILGKPKLRWLDDAQMEVRRCKSKAVGRAEWDVIIKEAKALHGLAK